MTSWWQELNSNLKKKLIYQLILLNMLLFSFSGTAVSQKGTDSLNYQHNLDSLQDALSKATTDTSRSQLMLALADTYQYKDRQKAFQLAKQALEAAEQSGDQRKIGRAQNYLGDLYWFSGDFASSSEHYFKALKIYEELKDKAGMADCYRNIGWIYQGQQRYDLTLEYYFKSLEINKQLKLDRKIIANYDDLGICYKLMKNFPEALKYCEKTIELARGYKSAKGLATGYGNLASIYVNTGQLDLAIENFQLSNKYHENLEDHFNCSEGYVGMAECYFKLDNFRKALEYAEKGATMAAKYEYKHTEASGYRLMAEAYGKLNDYPNGFHYMIKFSNLQDSLNNEESSRQINEMSAKYDSEKKELMISSLEKDKAQDKKFKIFMILFSIIIAVFTVGLFRSNLQKKKTNNSLSLAYKEIEVKNKDITDSINYAKQIQRARLSNPNIVLNLFPECFGLYKPKDVVSGDFYWFAEHESGKLMIAAADCTGHGIPGAFMSMIGIDELNHATLEKRIDDPSAVLTSVNRGLKKALRQNEKDSMSRDGMDIALIIINKRKMMIEYAGANRPLYLIRDNQLKEIAPTKAAIGGITPNEQEFKCHTFELKKNDMLYLFTDGYADQFGGPEGKKFMTKRFKDLLLSIHSKPAQEQEAILESTLNSWKKEVSQVDDILVLGIRV
jgi:serine phosphatase RsbU (regulator of sigma subunit)